MEPRFRFTRHAEERIWGRLAELVNASEVVKAIESKHIPTGRSNVEIKRINCTQIADPSVQPDGIARGDQLVAVVDNQPGNARIVTIILRKSWSKSPTYATIL